LYLAFLVWTQAELEKHHSKMYKAETLANAHLSKSYEELDQWQAASGARDLFQQAVHYQAARAAHGAYVLHHRESSGIWQMTPLESNLKRMDSGLLVLANGSMWGEETKTTTGIGGILGAGKQQHALLGRALIRRK
jgi:hypothetical protein